MHQRTAFQYMMGIILSFGFATLIKRYQPMWIDGLQRAMISPLNLWIPVAFLLFLMVFAWAMGGDPMDFRNVIKEPGALGLHALLQIVIKPLVIYGLSAVWFYGIALRWQAPKQLTTQLMVMVLIGSSTSALIGYDHLENKEKDKITFYSLLMVFNVILLSVFFVPLVKIYFLLNERGIVNPLFHGEGRIKPFPSIQLYLPLGLYVVFPMLCGIGLRALLEKRKGDASIKQKVLPIISGVRQVCWVILLTFLFSVQSSWSWLAVLYASLALIPLILSWLLLALFGKLMLRRRYSSLASTPLIWGMSTFFFELVFGILVGLKLGNDILWIPVLSLLLEHVVIAIIDWGMKSVNAIESIDGAFR